MRTSRQGQKSRLRRGGGRLAVLAAVLATALATGLGTPQAQPASERGSNVAAKTDDELLVRRGDKVTVRVDIGGISVALVARALESGRSGDTVLVKNERSGKRLRGTVVEPGVVRIEPLDTELGGGW